MLEELRISSLGVIDQSTLTLGPGLTVITGETGAGKTMIVTALGLLLGARSDAGAVRTGASKARVEGVVRADAALATMVDQAGGDVEDDTVLIARTVSADGRSRGFLGGAATPVATLASVGDHLVAVHGQSDQHRLLQPRAQLDALDRYAGLTEAVIDYGEVFTRLRAAEAELAEVTASVRERAREADLLRFGVGEIEAVSPEPGEDVVLAHEEERLGHADTLRVAAEQAREALSSDDGGVDALAAASAARSLLTAVREHDPAAAALADRLGEAVYLISDLAADVASYASGIEVDSTRLAGVSQRRADLTALTRKYGETIDEVLDWRARAGARLVDLEATDDTITELRAEVDRLTAEAQAQADALSSARSLAAGRLGAQVTGELTSLAMPNAEVSVTVTGRDDLGPTGRDEVVVALAANTGSAPRPLAKGASGGELSRVMLAIEVSLADTHSVPTMVFDEVDAGVGGTAAVEVGRRLAALARHTQVLVVTHLPQVAAYADSHVVISKSSDGTITSSGLEVLDDAGRERELSRMLAGLTESETARAHARELLEVARAARS
ncbi:MAG: DNA repair protein RecN [Nocardioides sp.]